MAGRQKLAKIPLNGPECVRVLELAAQIAAISERNEPVRQQRVTAMWGKWGVVHENMQKWHMTDDVLQAAKAGGIAFAREYTDVYGEALARVPDYLHLLCYHADWFWGVDENGHFMGPPAWWSTTALEKSHSLHKRKLRYKTMHGMPVKFTDARGVVVTITHAPHIYQLFQWQIREYVWRWNGRLRETANERNVSLTDLSMLYRCCRFETTPDDPMVEEEICHMLCLPRGCSVHLIGRGKLAMTKAETVPEPTLADPLRVREVPQLAQKVHVQVSRVSQAALDVVTRSNNCLRGNGAVVDNVVVFGRISNRARAQFKLSPATVAGRKRRRVEAALAKGRAAAESLDFSHISSA